MNTPFYKNIESSARLYGLDIQVVTALVSVESSFNPSAWNPEPRYRYFWNVRSRSPFRPVSQVETVSKFPPADFPTLEGDPDQEWWGQQASWGLMQIMGAVAREEGFGGPYLPYLIFDPATGLDIGCRHLARLQKWAGGNINQALAAYNGGKAGNDRTPYRNADYVAKVTAAQQTLRA